MKDQQLSVRPYAPGDEDALIRMFSEIFRDRSIAEWEWLVDRGPAGPTEVLVLAAGDRVAGCIAHVPVTASIEGRRVRLQPGRRLVEHVPEILFEIGLSHGADSRAGPRPTRREACPNHV